MHSPVWFVALLISCRFSGCQVHNESLYLREPTMACTVHAWLTVMHVAYTPHN